jgi:hypothetical protein
MFSLLPTENVLLSEGIAFLVVGVNYFDRSATIILAGLNEA